MNKQSATYSKSKAKKTNVSSPTENTKRGQRLLPSDANRKIIRSTVVENNVNS